MSARKRPRNGKPGSTPTGLLSKAELKAALKSPGRDLQRLLRAVYDRYQKLEDPIANAAARHDFPEPGVFGVNPSAGAQRVR